MTTKPLKVTATAYQERLPKGKNKMNLHSIVHFADVFCFKWRRQSVFRLTFHSGIMNTNVITIASLRTMQTMLQSKGIFTFHFLYPPRDCCQCIPFYGLQKYLVRELFSKMADSGNLLL